MIAIIIVRQMNVLIRRQHLHVAFNSSDGVCTALVYGVCLNTLPYNTTQQYCVTLSVSKQLATSHYTCVCNENTVEPLYCGHHWVKKTCPLREVSLVDLYTKVGSQKLERVSLYSEVSLN